MKDGTEWRWQFLGFESEEEGRPVQSWYNGLPDDAKEEISDLLGYLEKMTSTLWRLPEFDPLNGEGGISELRPRNVVLETGGEVEEITYRLYGFFGPKPLKAYTLLHGARKNEKNDRDGKRIAKWRLGQLEGGRARVHEFEF